MGVAEVRPCGREIAAARQVLCQLELRSRRRLIDAAASRSRDDLFGRQGKVARGSPVRPVTQSRGIGRSIAHDLRGRHHHLPEPPWLVGWCGPRFPLLGRVRPSWLRGSHDRPRFVDPDAVRNVHDAEALVDHVGHVHQGGMIRLRPLDVRSGHLLAQGVEAHRYNLHALRMQLGAQGLPPGQVVCAASVR